MLKTPYFAANHTLETSAEDNGLERKVNLLKLVDLSYNDLEKLLVMHRPILVQECLNKLFPTVPVHLLALERYQLDCAEMVQMVLPHCLEISKASQFSVNFVSSFLKTCLD